jgi:CPA2 family monovalent cation:H+ antiporter-2
MENIPFLLTAGLILCVFSLASFASERLKLPSVLLFIVLGLSVSPFFLGNHGIHAVAEVGIVLLFFVLGLDFPFSRMIGISKNIWPAGLIDVALNLIGSMLIALMFGMNVISSFIVGSMAYATSSSISAKELEEKKRLANPEAEFILALLIFEDLVAPVLVSVIAGMGTGGGFSTALLILLVGKILLLLGGALFIGHVGFRKMDAFLGKHIQKEFIPLLAVGLALGYAGLAVWLGLSEVLGAFLAGVMLSEANHSREIEHLILPIRNITLPFFFFWFGTTIDLGQGVPYVGMLSALLLWAMIGKICTAYYGSRLFGLNKKVSVRAAFSMVQRGEFSAIIASLSGQPLKIFSGVYILISAFLGIFLFGRAPSIANWYSGLRRSSDQRKANTAI